MLGSFTAGLLAGGVLSAVVLWLLGGLVAPVPQAVRYGLIIAFAVLAVLRDAGLVRFPLPQNARQIPQDVLRRGTRGALRFGFELGTGVRTYVSATSPYVLAAALLLAGPGIAAAVLAGIGFGGGRALTPLVRYASGRQEDWDRALRSRLRAITVGGALAVAACLALFLLT
ncbi:hypothetical protein ACTG9Q_12870 [Actinokineospora sp. 24-640]